MPIIQVSERLLSGLIEILLKQYISDKTNWRTMLKGDAQSVDLNQYKNNFN